MTSYVDGLFGKVMAALEATGRAEDTVVLATADHGDMLGERGLWYKMSFFERSVRVPLVLAGPGIGARRVPENVSLVDLLPTFLDIARDGGGAEAALVEPVDGRSLLPLVAGDAGGWPDLVHGEYMAEGLTQPLFMIKRGSRKYVACEGDPPQLYDLASDPDEQRNLAGDPTSAGIEREFAAEAARRWNSAAIRDAVIESQRRRIFIQEALLKGKIHPWDWQPFRDASKLYNRNYGAELYDTDRRARIPHRAAPKPDGPGR
jgi:choline-sulfatase